MSYVFYDTETTGLNTCYDQILQFGAIRTDHELRELERFEIRCRLLPHVVPSPEALLTIGIGVERLTDSTLPSHYEMVRAIKAKLDEWSPAVFIGHNSMRYDEILLRQALYQTLHGPYLTNTGGNCRLDSLSIFHTVSLFQPGVLSVPVGERGRLTFSLASLAPANGFSHDAAHDAIGDAEATLHLCRLVHERAEGYWSNFVRFGPKAAVLDFVEASEVFVLVGAAYSQPYFRMVTLLGPSPDYDSQVFVFNLSHDPQELAALSDEDLGKTLAASPVPVRGLRTNAGPCILPYQDVPTDKRAQAPGIDDLRHRATYIRGNRAFTQRLITAAAAAYEPRDPPKWVEEQLYDGFPGPEDQTLMAAFHDRDWSSRVEILGRLADTRLQVLGERLLYSEAPGVIPIPGLGRYRRDIANRLMADQQSVPWLTLPEAIRQAKELLPVSTGAETVLLKGLLRHLAERAQKARVLME